MLCNFDRDMTISATIRQSTNLFEKELMDIVCVKLYSEQPVSKAEIYGLTI